MKAITAYGLFILFMFIGWVWNIVEIIQADSVTGLVVARVIGVFVAPVGSILGYF
jgi:hypothetical protein